MSNENKHMNYKTSKKIEWKITKIIKLLQSATLEQLEEIEIFIKTYLT